MNQLRKFSRFLLLAPCLLLALWTAPSEGYSQSASRKESLAESEQVSKPSRLNNKNFQKNLEKYAHELDLTPKQVKKLNRLERKYYRKETRLARKPSTKKKHLKSLQKEKREQMIAVLTYEQQQKLQRLSKTNFWDFVRARD